MDHIVFPKWRLDGSGGDKRKVRNLEILKTEKELGVSLQSDCQNGNLLVVKNVNIL